MNISANSNPQALHLSFGQHRFDVELKDGRILSVPYTWFPRLIGASSELLNHYELSGNGEGIHWPDLDEDISVQGLLAGYGDQTNFARKYWQEHPEHLPFHATESAA